MFGRIKTSPDRFQIEPAHQIAQACETPLVLQRPHEVFSALKTPTFEGVTCGSYLTRKDARQLFLSVKEELHGFATCQVPLKALTPPAQLVLAALPCYVELRDVNLFEQERQGEALQAKLDQNGSRKKEELLFRIAVGTISKLARNDVAANDDLLSYSMPSRIVKSILHLAYASVGSIGSTVGLFFLGAPQEACVTVGAAVMLYGITKFIRDSVRSACALGCQIDFLRTLRGLLDEPEKLKTALKKAQDIPAFLKSV